MYLTVFYYGLGVLRGEALGVSRGPFASKVMVLLRTSFTFWYVMLACTKLHHAFTLRFIKV